MGGGTYDEPMDITGENEEYKGMDENVMMVVDKGMIVTVLRNLVMNGIQFTHPGGFIELTASKLDGETVLISVSDTGVGMSEETRLTLFESPSPHRPRRGTGNELGSGMGIVLCRDFVERHKGKIWVARSELDKGTRIEMTLPATMAQFKLQQLQEEEETSHIYYKLGVA